MTAEIAILNNSGIALAADSAVTIGNQKVYNSANKLFTLSKYQPVGIMVYDSADLMNIPWEIIIKEYRATLGTDRFKKLSEYADSFWEFIRTSEHVIPEENKKLYVVTQAHTYLEIISSELEKRVNKQISSSGEITIEGSLPILRNLVEEYNVIINKTPFIAGFSDEDVAPILQKWSNVFDEETKYYLGELYGLLSEEDKASINKQIAKLFLKDRFLLITTGVVIAGFGTTDMFPKIASYLVEGVIDNKVKKVFNEVKSNIQNETFVTTIVPFAQDEMVSTFFEGIDPNINQFAFTYLANLFKKYPESLQPEDLGVEGDALSSVRKKLSEDGEKLFVEYKEKLSEFKRVNNIQPIIDMVNVLPKDELAAMAESLVNLTVFKRKVSKTVETVGGPIDVAVISKGDGFVWVKRKHYFKPELNQHFFSNYFNKGKVDD